MKKKLMLTSLLNATVLAGTLAISMVAASGADYATTLKNLNPIGYWRLNEPTQPVVPTYPMTNFGTAGAVANGTYYGVPSLGQPGALASDADTAAQFGTISSYAEVPYSTALNPATSFTVEFWAKRTNSATATASVLCNFGPSRSNGYLVFAGNADLKWTFRTYSNTTRGSLISTAAIVQDQWTHVVCVHDGTGTGANSIYLDGVLDSTLSPAPYVPQAISNMRIGIGPNNETPAWPFPGLLDDIAIYSSALTPTQIAAHYEAATNAAPATPYKTLVQTDGAVTYWRLNEPTLPLYVPYAATNSGTLGSAQDGKYSMVGSTTGGTGPVRQQFAGFESDNKSVALNGTSGQISIPGFAKTTDTCTITGWIKRNGTQVGTSPFLFQRATGSPATGLVVNFTDRVAYSWNDDAGSYNYNPGADFYIPDGVWTFAALTVTSTNATIYIGSTNGLKSATRTAAHQPHDFSGGPLAIGQDTGSTTRFVKGNLDEIAIFDQALDYSAISNLFYAATPAIPLVTRTLDPLYEGMTVTFSAFGVGGTPVTYQWRKDGSNLSGKTSSTLVLNSVTVASSGNYDVVVTGGALSVTSAVSAITIVAGPPVIVQQPVSITRFEGAVATFSVANQGSTPWSFQWKKGGTAITGATASSYTIPVVHTADAGSYTVTITNPLGSTNSAAATLTILPGDNYATQMAYSGAGAYWQLNEKSGTVAYDYIGGLNCTIAGVITNNVVSVRPPTYAGYSATNTCFAFAGGNTSDGLSTPTLLNFTNTSITMAAWVMPYSGLLAVTSDVNFVANAGGMGINSAGTDGKVRAHPLWGSDTGLTFSFDTWNYVVVIWTPNGQTFYLDNGDGSGLRTSTVGGTIDPNTWKGTPFYIGRQAGRTDRGWPGQIDELALFDRALTPSEVTNLYVNAIKGPTAPSIIAQPQSQTVLAGTPVSFTVGVLGSLPMSFQWRHAGVNLPGATANSLTIASPSYTDAGTYDVVVSNGIGSPATSAAAILTVQAPATYAYLTNDLVLHLRFDGDYLDTSGRTNDAMAPYLPPAFLGGKIGQGVHIASTTGNDNQYLQVTDVAGDLVFNESASFSVGYWVRYTAGFNDTPIIGNAINSTYQLGWVFTDSDPAGKVEYSLVSPPSGGLYVRNPVPGCPVINNGAWHHVLGVVDRASGMASVYVDGAIAGSWSIAGLGSLDSGNAVTIGQDPLGNYGSATFDMDDLGIWRRALTPGEASGIYAAGQIGQSFDVKGPMRLTLQTSGSGLELIWSSGTLESADNVGGPYNTVVGAAAPYYKVPAGADKKFYRVKL